MHNQFESYTLSDEPIESELQFAARLRESFPEAIDYLIPQQIPKGSQTEVISVRVPVEAARALNEILHRPGSLHKTKGDLLRVAVNLLIAYICRHSEDQDDAWVAFTTQGKMLANFAHQRLAMSSLYQGAVALRNTLVLQLGAGMDQEALRTYKRFLTQAQLGAEDWRLRALKILREMPSAQEVAWIFRESGEIPEEFDLVPNRPPNKEHWDSGIGLPPDPDSVVGGFEEQEKAMVAAYHRGYEAGKRVKGG